MHVITDGRDKQLPNQLPTVLETLKPFRPRLKVVAFESTYNWYWLVDGLMEHGHPVILFPTKSGWGPALVRERRGHEVQIRMDDCTKEPPAFGRRTRCVAPRNFAGVKDSHVPGTFREIDVTLQNSRQPKAGMSSDS